MQKTEQVGNDGRLRHLLTLDGLPRAMLEHLLERAAAIAADQQQTGRPPRLTTLAGRTVATLFFEPSTAARSSSPRHGSAPTC